MTQTSGWPSPGDYSATIQNPQNCFADPELKVGRAVANTLGLPIGASGNFAVVYQLRTANRSYAVRCFIRPVTDQQQRYEALSQHLSGFTLPTLVDFAYLSQGIRIRGQWYPIVRMEWVAGQPLQRHVEDHLQQPEVLRRLAAQWRGVVAGLRGAYSAHGDLQHGNILVDGQGRIMLVDYDGLFIPALRGRPPGEVGHPNYQHPERLAQGYYEENADAFSALVIYLSLIALRSDPRLWTFHNGDNLIFVSDDFLKPGQTPVWQRLRAVRDPEVKRLVDVLVDFCRGPVAVVADLEAVLQSLPGGVPTLRQPTPLVSPVPAALMPPPTSDTVACPKCRHVNKATAIYCEKCSRQLYGSRSCPRCRKPVPVNARFCHHCQFQL